MVLSGLTFQRIVLRAVCTFIIFALPLGVRGQASDVVGTMPEDYLPDLKRILATAVSRSPSLIEQQFLIELRDAGKIAVRAARLPSLGSNISYGSTELRESGDNNARSRDNGLFYNFGLNQALFYWGELKNRSEISRINVALAEKNFEKGYRELSTLLRKLYLELVVLKSRVRQARETHRLALVAIDITKERVGRGVAAPAEVASEELRARELVLFLRQAEENLLAARLTFSRLAGISELRDDLIPSDIPKPLYSEALATALASTLLRDGAKNTVDAKMHDLRAREAMLSYRIARVRLLPKFEAGAGYSLENTTTVGTSVGQKAVARQTFNVTARWPIFDGFATRAAKMEARAAQRAVEARRTAELDALMQEVQTLDRQLKLDAETAELAEVRRSLAVDTKRRNAEEVGFGKLSQMQVERAEIEILQADVRNLEARATLLLRWSQLVAIAGEDPVVANLPVRHVRTKE